MISQERKKETISEVDVNIMETDQCQFFFCMPVSRSYQYTVRRHAYIAYRWPWLSIFCFVVEVCEGDGLREDACMDLCMGGDAVMTSSLARPAGRSTL